MCIRLFWQLLGYNCPCPLTQVILLAAGVLLPVLIPISAGLVSDKKGGVEFATFPANGKEGPPALNNNKQENV